MGSKLCALIISKEMQIANKKYLIKSITKYYFYKKRLKLYVHGIMKIFDNPIMLEQYLMHIWGVTF